MNKLYGTLAIGAISLALLVGCGKPPPSIEGVIQEVEFKEGTSIWPDEHRMIVLGKDGVTRLYLSKFDQADNRRLIYHEGDTVKLPESGDYVTVVK